MADLTIWVQPLDGQWTALEDVEHESLTLVANTWGPDTASFNLRRDPTARWGDLLTDNPVEIFIDGTLVWDGFIDETPSSSGDDEGVTVNCRGWQHHTDDDPHIKTFVHSRTGDWVDSRSLLLTPLATYTAAGQVEANDGAITLMYPAGLSHPQFNRVGVTIDLKQADISQIVVEWDSSNNASGAQLYARMTPTNNPSDSTTSDPSTFPVFLNTGASGITIGTWSGSKYRYLHLFIYRSSATGTNANDIWVKLKKIRLFADPSYQSWGQSILYASDVLKASLVNAPRLDQDTSLIQPTSVAFPDFAPLDDRTVRDIIEAANAPHRWQPRLRVGRLLEYRPYPVNAKWEMGRWTGAEFTQSALSSREEIASRVIVSGSDESGQALRVVRTNLDTLPQRRNYHRTKQLSVSAGLTTAIANTIGDAYLAAHKKTPLKGEMVFDGPGGLRGVGGGIRGARGEGPHPSSLLADCGELVRFTHLTDPDTGASGREGMIAQVSYSHQSEACNVSIDSTADNLEALLQRYAIVSGQG